MIGVSVIKAHFCTTVSVGSVELLCTLILFKKQSMTGTIFFVHGFCNGCPHIHVKEWI